MQTSTLIGAAGIASLAFALGYLAASQEPAPSPRGAADAAPPATQTEAALRAALGESDPLVRSARVAEQLQTLGPEAQDAVVLAFEATGTTASDPELALLAEWWARHDPEAAFTWAHRGDNGAHPWITAAVLRTWARSDPEAAVQAWAGLRMSEVQHAGLAALALGWDESGRPGLIRFLQGFEQGKAPQSTIEALVRRRLVRDGVEPTLRWAESLPPDPPGVLSRFKQNVMRRTAGALADHDPARAMAWVDTFGETPLGRGAYRRVALRAVRRAPVETMEWLKTLPAGNQRDSAVQEGYRIWISMQTAKASEWIEQQELAPWLDPALEQYCQVLAKRDPREGLAWAQKISWEPRRQRMGKRLARGWFTQEPAEARAWIEASEWLTDDSKAFAVTPQGGRAERAQKQVEDALRQEAEAPR